MELFKQNERLSASSKKLYTHNLKKLNDGQLIKNLNYLKHYNIIDEKLMKLCPNTRRSYVIAIVSATKGLERFDKTHKYYYDKMMELNKELKDQTSKTDKEKENWMTQEEIQSKFEDLYKVVEQIGKKRKLTDETYSKLLDCVLLGLYVLSPPRRNLDYCKMLVETPDGQRDANYYFKNQFIFNIYKTAKTYEQQVIDVPERLTVLLKLYLKFKPKECTSLLVNEKGKGITTGVDIGRRLVKIFDGTKITSSMLRKIYLTSKYSDVLEELEKDTTAMGTSVGTAQLNYIKDE